MTSGALLNELARIRSYSENPSREAIGLIEQPIAVIEIATGSYVMSA